LKPEEWQRVRSLLESALELDATSRSRFLDEACSDAALRLEVESLIEIHEQADTDILESPAIAGIVADDFARFRLRRGERIGAYEILGEIAQGGMGAVYRAVRADGQYTQEVALKIVGVGFGAELTAARFRNERQILASLDHPNIARLLDGGTSVDGLPYFVMEFIDGLQITAYCDRHKLSIDARLQLFRKVCAAVHYAHQRLVIHRDVKPTNILVTADGVPKLLDFGIAKVLDGNEQPLNLALTGVGLRLMTPEYASPEQLRGEAVTTATDVYSLGMVLYELLAGRPAYYFRRQMPQDIAKVVCETDPQKPSVTIQARKELNDRALNSGERAATEICSVRGTTVPKLRKRLQGDLDNIVLMALRKEPERRYASAEQFAEDIRRNGEHIPVIAHQDSPWYRTSKFVARHRAGVAAAGVILILLVAGLAATLYEARVARRQAEIAGEQRARAERRFNDVRKLANSLMFEVHDSIKDLPGATPARKFLVDRALEYLDSLSQEMTGDATLQRELAAAYDRVGDALGNTASANLGDFPGALQSYKKALAIRESSAAANPKDVQIQSDLLNDYFKLSFVLEDAGDYPGALDNLQKGLPVALRLVADHPDLKYKDWLAGIYWKRGNVFSAQGDNIHALESFRQSIEIREPIAIDIHANPAFRTHLAGDYIGLGKALGNSGDVANGVKYARKGVQILEQVSQSSPNNATLREYLGEAYGHTAQLLRKQEDLAQALIYCRKAQTVFGELLSADSKDSLARDNLAFADLNTGVILSLQGKTDEALPNIRRSDSTFAAIQQKNRYEIGGQADASLALARAYVAIADRDGSPSQKTNDLLEARSWFQKSLQTSQMLPPNSETSLSKLPAAKQNSGSAQELANCEAALAKLQNHKRHEGAEAAPQP